VSTREAAEEMDVSAVPVNSGELAVLTASDLAVRNELEGVEYAYIANETRLRLGAWGGGSGGGPGEGPPPEGGPPPEDGSDDTGQRTSRQTEPAPETDSPEPVLEEIYGYQVTPEFFTAHDLIPAAGTLITEEEIERGRPVMVLGADLAVKLFQDGISMGRDVYARRQLYSIIGILEPTGTEYDGMFFSPAIVPSQVLGDSRMARMFFSRNPTSLHFVIQEPDKLDETKARLSTIFEDRYGEFTTIITLPREEAESLINRNKRISLIILFLAISGLLIADVNVSNILLGRMVRSRKKIGILKALGAAKGHIFNLFSVEGFFLSAAGAVLGVGVSFLIFRIIQQSLGLTSVFPAQLLIGVLLAWVITMGLTIFPALQASKIPAADAMRHE
jgi:putative ABC transport system permease protein